MTVSIRITGLIEVKRMLGADYKPAIQAAADGVGRAIEGELMVQPGLPRHPLAWASARQRRWWFAQRGDRGPYKRGEAGGQDLLGSWAMKRRGMGAILGSRADYAIWVQSKAHQQPFHRETGWVTDEEAIRRVVESGDAKRIVVQAVMGALRRKGI